MAESQRPFDLAAGPLLRAVLLVLDEEEHALLLTHAPHRRRRLVDGRLIREMGALYEAFVGGAPPPLPQLPVQYADYAPWQRSWLQGEALEAQLAYWRERLAERRPARAAVGPAASGGGRASGGRRTRSGRCPRSCRAR